MTGFLSALRHSTEGFCVCQISLDSSQVTAVIIMIGIDTSILSPHNHGCDQTD